MNLNPSNILLNQIMNAPQFRNNAVMQNAFKMYQNGDEKGVIELCQNVCQSNGTSIEEMRKKYGI